MCVYIYIYSVYMYMYMCLYIYIYIHIHTPCMYNIETTIFVCYAILYHNIIT